MKYVYAVMTIVDGSPMMQTLLSEQKLSGRDVLERVVMTPEEKVKYKAWRSAEDILTDMNRSQAIKVEVQEVEV